MRSATLFYTFTEAKTIVLKAAVKDKSSPPPSFRDLRGNVAHPVAHGCSFLKLLFQPSLPSRGCSAALLHWQRRALPGAIPPEQLAGLGHHLWKSRRVLVVPELSWGSTGHILKGV